jgi:hypothetical protein
MMKAADDRSGGRRRSRRHNNQPSTEYCSGGVGSNNNGCRDDGGKGNGGSEGFEDQLCPTATAPHRRDNATAASAGPRALPPRQRQRPPALEDQLVLHHGFVPADRPATPPAMTTTTRMTALGPNAAKTMTTAASAGPRASPLRRRLRPLALEDQLVLRHGFVPANRPRR